MVATALLNAGFALPKRADRSLLLSWLTGRPARRITIHAQRIGFRDDYTTFLTPHGAIGSPKQRVSFASAHDEYVARFVSKGTLREWKAKVATPASASSRYVFLASAALAAPLLPIVGMESRGVHVVSPAGTAKTSAFVFAGSAMGIGGRSDLPKLKTTNAGLDDLAFGHNHCPLLLDELGLLDGTADQRSEQIRRIAYGLASGVTKVRSKAYTRTAGLQTGQFALLFFTNGEEALAEVAARGARKRSGGETSRFVDLPGARPGSCGLIDRIPKSVPDEEREQWARERVDQIRAACALHHGHAFPAFVKEIIANRLVVKDRVERLMTAFFRQTGVETIAGHERRKAELFAVAYAAGVLASRSGILPWTEERILKAVRRCYRDAAQPGPNSASLADGLEILRSHLWGPSLIDLRKTRPRSTEEMEAADGVVRSNAGVLEACVTSDRFVAWFSSKALADSVISFLAAKGLLDSEPGGRVPTKQVRLPALSYRPRCYVIKLTSLEAALKG